MFRIFLGLHLVLLTVSSIAQSVSNLSTLTIEQIMQGERFIGYSPTQPFWSQNGKTLYFNWNPGMDTLQSLYKVGLQGQNPEKVSLEEQKMLASRFGSVYSRDYSRMLYEKNGDIFGIDLSNGHTLQFTNTIEREFNAGFVANDSIIVYQSGDNLFARNLMAFTFEQLTDFRKGADKPSAKLDGWKAWLEKDQLQYFEILQERKAERLAEERRREKLQPERPLPIYYGEKRLSNLHISPELRFVTFQLVKSPRPEPTNVPNYVTESGFTEELRARTKVGSPQNTYEMGIYDRQRDTFYLVETKSIEGITDKPGFLKEYHKGPEAYEATYKKPREVAIHGPFFSDDGKAVVVVRSQDNKDRWIMLLDLITGNLKLLDRQRDEAWIGGPGIGWGGGAGNIGWADENTIWFQSEATGFSHLYTLNVVTLQKKQLTSGKFEVRDVSLSKGKEKFFLSATAEGPHELHFYHLPVAGGQLTKITSQPGNHEVALSPDETMLAVRYSYSNKPWELYLMENFPGAPMKQITKSTTAQFDKYPWRDPEIMWFDARDGVKVPARLYRPKSPKKKGPAVIFVHGAGYLQNVHKWWSSYSREYMFHNLLADHGYTVLDIDYRASDGYGRDWRTAIYRFMGGKDLDDNVDGAKFLVEKYGVDAGKIGIYGGSYGGFMTLMAMFTAPGTFKSGAALRSVTDWAHYNHGYTANILNTPEEDSIAYRRSSPIYHAEGLNGNLLLLHGMVDVNVHFQDVVRLSQRLIELGKDNWEFAVFPLEDHGFVEPSSWTDEYKRIFKLFQETLR